MANDHTKPEAQIRIYSYAGTPTSDFAKDGDFYVDELVNMLYGPKTNGVWPEDGTPAIGVCKRSVYGIKDARSRQAGLQKKRFSLGNIWRWCNKVKLYLAGSGTNEPVTSQAVPNDIQRSRP